MLKSWSQSDYCSHEHNNSVGRFSKLVRSFCWNRKAMQHEVIWDHKAQPSAIHDREKKKRPFIQVHEGSRFSERENRCHIPTEEQSRVRLRSAPCTTISEMNTNNPENLQRDPRFTDAAKKLSKKEMALLYEDIVKPLDVYSILIEKRKEMSERKWVNFLLTLNLSLRLVIFSLKYLI